MGDILTWRSRRWRQAFTILGTVLILYFLAVVFCVPPGERTGTGGRYFRAPASGRHGGSRGRLALFETLNLDEAQCNATFPGLMADIDSEVARGPFTLKQTTGTMGPLQARIEDGRVSFLSRGVRAQCSSEN